MNIHSTKDSVANEQSIIDNKNKMPATAKFVKIEGASHAQFGYYGFQLLDNSATISREQHQRETLNKIIKFIRERRNWAAY